MRTTRSGSRSSPTPAETPAAEGAGDAIADGDLATVTSWGLLVEVYAAGNRRLEADLMERHGIPLTWFEVLLRLARSEEQEQRVSALAAQVSFSSGGFTRLADRMIAAGLIERRVCPTDRRGALLTLTEAGRTLVAAAVVTHATCLRERVLVGLSPAQQREWDATHRTLRDHLTVGHGD